MRIDFQPHVKISREGEVVAARLGRIEFRTIDRGESYDEPMRALCCVTAENVLIAEPGDTVKLYDGSIATVGDLQAELRSIAGL